MELLVCPVKKASFFEGGNFVCRCKCHMGGRHAALVGKFAQSACECEPHGMIVIGDMIEEARAGGGGKWHCRLKFGIIAAACTLEGVRPAMIEHIFALAMAFEIVRHCADKIALIVFEAQMTRQPASLSGNAAGLFQRGQKSS